MSPTPSNGKICYLAIPAQDPETSSDFYRDVFGWTVRRRGDGAIAFDDSTGQVSGTWTTVSQPSPPGILIYVMVDSVAAALEAVVARGGRVVQPVGQDLPEITARFSDPAGNLIGLYQEPEQPPGD